MSRHLHIDPVGGVAGDMMLAALTDLADDARSVRALPARLGLGAVEVECSPTQRHGLGALKISVRTGRPAAHRHAADIRQLVAAADLPAPVRDQALAVFERLLQAEAEVHGQSPEALHLHEVGADDALVDVCGSCLLLHELEIDAVTSGPLPVCRGLIEAAHGRIPLPAPAVMRLAEGWPLDWIDGSGERVTPTGAALLCALARPGHPPAGRLAKTGYGAGAADFPDRPNILRAVLLETDSEAAAAFERVHELVAAVDDASGEQLAHAAEILLGAGALDAYYAPLVMKKGRPGWQLTVLSSPEQTAALSELVLRHTSSGGVRRRELWRWALRRRTVTVQTAHGEVRLKIFTLPGGGERAAAEFEDCRRIAQASGLSLRAVQALADEAYRRTEGAR